MAAHGRIGSRGCNRRAAGTFSGEAVMRRLLEDLPVALFIVMCLLVISAKSDRADSAPVAQVTK